MHRSQSPVYSEKLSSPTLVGKQIACITLTNGVQLFDTSSFTWTNNPPLLDAATSVAISLNRNIVVQTKDSIQIFSLDALTGEEIYHGVHSSHVYPLGKTHIICILQPAQHLALLKLETLQELQPDDNTSILGSLLTSHMPFSGRLVAGFDISLVMQAWQSGAPLRQTEATDKGVSLSGLSPKCTRIVTVYHSPQPVLCVKDTRHGMTLAKIHLGHDLGTGEVYDLTFDSETRFYLKIDELEQCVEIPYDTIESPSGHYSHTLAKGQPMPLSEPRPKPPYTLDTNCEWVLDAKSRKVCWTPPGDIRKGIGGHFWVGPSLTMVGDDGIVKKLSFKNPDS